MFGPNMFQTQANLWFRKNLFGIILASLLILSLVVFLLCIRDYGISWDEPFYYDFADVNLFVIKNFIYGIPFDHLFEFYDLRYYGPAYLILGNSVIQTGLRLFPTLVGYDAWHTLNFILFLFGAWLIFTLSTRFVSAKSALFAAALYLTQPLLWGHGIINPKDTPFMVFFLATVTAGLNAVDCVAGAGQPAIKGRNSLLPGIKSWKIRFLFILLFGIFLIFTVDRLSANSLSKPVLTQLFEHIHTSSAGSIFYPLKVKIAAGTSEGIPAAAYFDKALKQVNLIEFISISAVCLWITVHFLIRMPASYRRMILAGALLGLTMSIRVLGPAAGALVVLYAVLKYGKSPVKHLEAYLGAAVLVMYLFWPYLWNNPIGRFVETFQVMVNFPWQGTVRFNGIDYPAMELPWYYLPKLMSMQLTLPVVILSLTGIGLAIFRVVKDRTVRPNFLVILPWFLLPLLLVVLITPTMYDNFRQFLFILPPLFIFAGLAVEKIRDFIPNPRIKSALGIALLMPGIIAGVWLHPYEYVYYNGLVGWTGGVERNYENDYWGTSLCEAGKFLSAIAEPNAQIAFTNPQFTMLFKECAENNFEYLVERADQSEISPDFSVIVSRYDDDLDYFRSMKTIKTIERGETVFLVIKMQSQ